MDIDVDPTGACSYEALYRGLTISPLTRPGKSVGNVSRHSRGPHKLALGVLSETRSNDKSLEEHVG
jgi:hypothetical protein